MPPKKESDLLKAINNTEKPMKLSVIDEAKNECTPNVVLEEEEKEVAQEPVVEVPSFNFLAANKVSVGPRLGDSSNRSIADLDPSDLEERNNNLKQSRDGLHKIIRNSAVKESLFKRDGHPSSWLLVHLETKKEEAPDKEHMAAATTYKK